MDDAKYLFLTDTKEKKITARSAFRKARKSGCKLPSDYMTEKEKKSMNGTVETFNLHKPMKYQAYKLMSPDMQKEYIQGIVDTFGVTLAEISEMMKISRVTLSKQTGKLGIVWKNGGSCHTGLREEFQAWACGEKEWPVIKSEPIMLDVPMPDKAFYMLTPEQAYNYLQYLVKTYKVSCPEIADMLSIPRSTLASIAQRHAKKLGRPSPFAGGKKKKKTLEQQAAWAAFCKGSEASESDAKQENEVTQEYAVEAVEEPVSAEESVTEASKTAHDILAEVAGMDPENDDDTISKKLIFGGVEETIKAEYPVYNIHTKVAVQEKPQPSYAVQNFTLELQDVKSWEDVFDLLKNVPLPSPLNEFHVSIRSRKQFPYSGNL